MPAVLIAIFTAKPHILDTIDALSTQARFDISQALVVMRTADGQLKILEGELRPQEARRLGRRFGALMTTLGLAQIGALALPGLAPILALGVGALLGGWVGGATGRFAVQLIRAGFQAEQIDRLTAHLKQDQIALLLEVEDDRQVPALRDILTRQSIDLLETQLDEQQNIITPHP